MNGWYYTHFMDVRVLECLVEFKHTKQAGEPCRAPFHRVEEAIAVGELPFSEVLSRLGLAEETTVHQVNRFAHALRTRDISLRALAEAIDVSRGTLNRMFRTRSGGIKTRCFASVAAYLELPLLFSDTFDERKFYVDGEEQTARWLEQAVTDRLACPGPETRELGLVKQYVACLILMCGAINCTATTVVELKASTQTHVRMPVSDGCIIRALVPMIRVSDFESLRFTFNTPSLGTWSCFGTDFVNERHEGRIVLKWLDWPGFPSLDEFVEIEIEHPVEPIAGFIKFRLDDCLMRQVEHLSNRKRSLEVQLNEVLKPIGETVEFDLRPTRSQNWSKDLFRRLRASLFILDRVRDSELEGIDTLAMIPRLGESAGLKPRSWSHRAVTEERERLGLRLRGIKSALHGVRLEHGKWVSTFRRLLWALDMLAQDGCHGRLDMSVGTLRKFLRYWGYFDADEREFEAVLDQFRIFGRGRGLVWFRDRLVSVYFSRLET